MTPTLYDSGKMVFKCQEDSFLQEFTSKIVSCEQVSPGNFDVICLDTIIFPEGGGQPNDTGFLDEKRVVNVVRKGSEAIHRVEAEDVPFKAGDSCVQKIDWPRRHDHMQQHSGQHLLSALFDQVYGYDTKSWWLGTDTSYIELDSKIPISEDQIRDIEEKCNGYIAQAVPITVSVFESLSAITSEDVKRATRGLPDDHAGQIRVINIEGVDSNMCCGTHVTNLSQLQSLKLLNLERPSKNKLILHFLVGDRIRKRFQVMFERELKFNLILNNGPASHIDLVEKMGVNVKRLQKAMKILSKEAALLEVEKLKQKTPQPEYLMVKRSADECDANEFLNVLIREVKSAAPDLKVLVVFMEDKPTSQLLVSSADEELLKRTATSMCEVLEITLGAAGLVCKNGRFQAKFANAKSIKKCDQVVANLLLFKEQ